MESSLVAFSARLVTLPHRSRGVALTIVIEQKRATKQKTSRGVHIVAARYSEGVCGGEGRKDGRSKIELASPQVGE